MLVGIPLIHLRHHFIGLMDGNHRPFSQNFELAVGNYSRDLNDPVVPGVQPGHFKIDPYQIAWRLGHEFSPSDDYLIKIGF